MLTFRSTALATLLTLCPAPLLAAFLGYGDPLVAFAPRAQETLPPGPGQPEPGLYAAFLDRYLETRHPDGIHRVRYGAVSEADQEALWRWLRAEAQRGPGGLSRDAQFAFWANLYNGLTLARVLDAYPISSILDIKRWPWSFGPWDETLLTVQGQALSLNAIEHRILRPLFQEPRVHFALNCASLGCPNLAPRPYDAKTLEAALQAGLEAYLAHPRGLSLEAGKLTLSSIFDWYRSDFPEHRDAFLAALAAAAPQALRAPLQAVEGPFAYRYDWALNDAKAP